MAQLVVRAQGASVICGRFEERRSVVFDGRFASASTAARKVVRLIANCLLTADASEGSHRDQKEPAWVNPSAAWLHKHAFLSARTSNTDTVLPDFCVYE